MPLDGLPPRVRALSNVGAAVIVAATPPPNPRDGQLWFDTTVWNLFLRVQGMWFFLC